MSPISIGTKTGIVRTTIGTLAIASAAALMLAMAYVYRRFIIGG